MAATWSETNKNSNIVLSNSDLTATAGSGATTDAAGIATVAITTGDAIYAEIVCVAKSGSAEPGVGLANASFAFGDGNYLGIDTNSVCLFQSNSIWTNDGHAFTADGFAAGDTIRMAVRKPAADTLHVWFAVGSGDWNADATADPSTDTGGFSLAISGDVYLAYNADFASATATAFTLVQPGSYSFSVPAGLTEYGDATIALAAAFTAASSMTASITRATPLPAAAFTAASSMAASLGADRGLAAAFTASSDVSGRLGVSFPFAAHFTGASAMSAKLRRMWEPPEPDPTPAIWSKE